MSHGHAEGPRRFRPRPHYRTCHLCEAMCGVAPQVKDDHVVSVRGDKDDPFSKGYPLSQGGGWATCIRSRSAALPAVAHRHWQGAWLVTPASAGTKRCRRYRRLATQRSTGRNAVAVYAGNPTVHSYSALCRGCRFSGLDALWFSATSGGSVAAAPPDGVPDVRASAVAAGAGRGSHRLHAHPRGQPRGIKRQPDDRAGHRQCGQRRSASVAARSSSSIPAAETAALCDRHHFIRPLAAMSLMLALLHRAHRAALRRPDAFGGVYQRPLARRRLVAEFTPERAAAPDRHRRRRHPAASPASSPPPAPAVCCGRMGVSTQEFGAVTQWLINVFQHRHRPRPARRAMFTRPAFDLVAMTARLGEGGHFDGGAAGAQASRIRRRIPGRDPGHGDPALVRARSGPWSPTLATGAVHAQRRRWMSAGEPTVHGRDRFALNEPPATPTSSCRPPSPWSTIATTSP